MLKYLMVMLLVSGPLMAENGFDRGTRHEARASKDRHDPKSAKQIEAARLNSEYQAEVDAWRDFTSTNKVSSYFDAARLNEQYQTDVRTAVDAKTVSKNYRAKEPVSDFGQCCPADDNNDGFVDGTSSDPDGIGGIP